ncbi:hypothetical protein ACFL6C_09310 [Myxococcota bacterium]
MSLICKAAGCKAQAWHQDLCNYHAFQRLRGRRTKAQERAAELGIELNRNHEQVGARTARKVRSPVA